MTSRPSSPSVPTREPVNPVVDPRQQPALLDLAAARVVRKLADAGVESILLKGPATRRNLYGGDDRAYADIDLLVAPAAWPAAVRTLAQLGFIGLDVRFADGYHALAYRNTKGVSVDLHRRVPGTRADDADGWTLLFDRSEAAVVGSGRARIPDRATTFAIVTLHAAHDPKAPKVLADLARAVSVADRDLWREALDVADQLGAREAFSAGLRLHPGGARLCDELGLAPPTRASVRLQADGSFHAAVLARAREMSAGARLAALLRMAFPTRDELLTQPWTNSMAARRATLPLAFVVRWFYAGSRLAAAAGPYRRARRAERASRRPSP